jgi:tetratricopeptide (TPR) repeat protein
MFLALTLAVATCLRVSALLALRASPYRDYLFTDERGYHDWAKNLAAGVSYYSCHVSPLPAYYMAALYRLFGPDPIYVRYANLVLGVATCWVSFGIGRRVGGTLVGLLSALIAVLYRPFILLSVTVLKEPLVLLTLSLTVLLFLGELERHRPWQSFCLGLCFGLIAILRPNATVAALVMVPLSCWRASGRSRMIRPTAFAALTLAAGALLPSAPFMLKNYQVAGRLTPAPQGGVELYLGNSNDRPYYTPAPFATPSPQEQGIHFRIEASRRAGRVLTFAEASSYWADQVASQAKREPLAFARRLFRKTIAALHAREESDNHSIEFLGSVIPFLRWPLLSYPLVMPLGMAGLVVGIRRHRGALPLLAVVIAYGFTLVLVYCNLRLRIPLLVVLIPFTATGLVDLSRVDRFGRSARVPIFVTVALFAFIEHIPLAGTGDLTGHYNTHASVLLEKGDQRGAQAYWRKSQRLRGTFSDFATLSLAALALTRGNADQAQQLLSEIPDQSFAAAFKYDLLGDALSQDHRAAEAALAYEKALQINSARRDTRQKLATLYRGLDAKERAMDQERVLVQIERFFAQR